ncbi:helix-turn-helix transcriptional regulator [Marivita sp. S6314]|uniref:winged helix-turn-helix transcriptional regulator n=1 Tax=Marivita sp. S6314 TaxID=2926406 RepID=UPI001FF10A10|nr:helix-turn-helix domain-containing protein [Marivita sp. S6314]MCK0151336.1 helix-turn-helix transcriptional regulator [Marivita sp. S6314]
MAETSEDMAETDAMVARYSVVRALAIVGDTWTILILRAAFAGTHRFSDWQNDLGIPKAVLASRLERLVENRILYKRPTQSGGKRMEYFLDEAGLELWEPLAAMVRWSRHWYGEEGHHASWFHHKTCGSDCDLILSCDICANPLTFYNTYAEDGPGAGLEPRIVPHSRRRANSAIRHGDDAFGSPEALTLFGDLWAPAIVATAFRGGRRFNDLVTYLRIPPLVLSMRLKELIAMDVLTRRTTKESDSYEAFHLTRKGLDLFPYISMLAKWGDRWRGDADGVPLVFQHRDCGHNYKPHFRCSACGDRLHRADVVFLDPLARS